MPKGRMGDVLCPPCAARTAGTLVWGCSAPRAAAQGRAGSCAGGAHRGVDEKAGLLGAARCARLRREMGGLVRLGRMSRDGGVRDAG